MQGQVALTALGDGLAAAGAKQGSTNAELGQILRTDHTAWLDRDARLFYVEQPPAASRSSADAPVASASATPEPSSYTASGVPVFHSLPAATNVVYLDFDGETISGTAWNVGTVDPLVAVPFDRDGDPTTFSADEVSHITGTWLRIAEDYAPFSVDVTTEVPAVFGPTTGRVLVTNSTDANGVLMPHDTSGGVSYVNVFGRADYSTYYSPVLVYSNNLFSAEYNIAEAASHEFGHNVGLHHDGTSTQAYYSGAGSSSQATSWAPIMGSAYYKNVTKFNNGDYLDANNQEDDLAIIGSKLGRRNDDVGPTPGSAAALTVAALNITGSGLINDSADQDLWGFQTGAGTVSLSISPFVRGYGSNGGDLDVKATLLDASGASVATDGPLDRTDASLSVTVAAGTYFFRVAADASDRSSIYGSQGQYTITGSIPNVYSVPSASLENAPPVTTTGVSSSTFDVAYFDLDGIDASSLGTGDVRVTGPNGFSQLATLASVSSATSGSAARVATYRVAAPGGTWDSPDNGTYAIALLGSEVTDTLGNAAPSGPLGSFTAALQRRVLYNATMAANPGWSLSTNWAYGIPTVTAGPTDRPLVGDTITGTGLYTEGIRATTATTPSFSTTGLTSVTFTVDTMLGVRSDDVASIDVGVGTKWTTIWSNNAQNVLDPGWTTRTFDISSLAANKASVQIRFVIGPTKAATGKVTTVSFGWNVGALQVTGR